jgi:predicted ATPase
MENEINNDIRNTLNHLTIKGFKSIKDLSNFEFKALNIMIGANGSGKSNLISFFKMLRALIDGNLNRYVRDQGGASDLLFHGRKVTQKMEFELRFGKLGFKFNLIPTPENHCAIEDEAILIEDQMDSWRVLGDHEDGHSRLVAESKSNLSQALYLQSIMAEISSWQIYHFHDTSATATMRHYEIVEDSKFLRADASNIAPFLLKLREEHFKTYQNILNAIRLVMPFFNDFILEPRKIGQKTEVNLSWTQKYSDYPMQPYHLSDGSIRFICLATTLLQPNPPSMMIIDEPELGLHPIAIHVLAELIQVASQKTQVLIATQSPTLLDQFEVEDILIVNQEFGASVFRRLREEDLVEWLKSYSVSELWLKNVISGGPSYE